MSHGVERDVDPKREGTLLGGLREVIRVGGLFLPALPQVRVAADYDLEVITLIENSAAP
jgi:hypothetical protein